MIEPEKAGISYDIEEDLNSLKADINYQLAINGFIKKQFIYTKSDLVKPFIAEKPKLYTNAREVKKPENPDFANRKISSYSINDEASFLYQQGPDS